MLVAPSTSTPVSSSPLTPFICTRNSVLMRRADSLSCDPLEPHNESTSSIKMMAGLDSRAISNKLRTNFSDSPNHFETRSALDTEKKVELASVATACAKYDFPVPGGPYKSIPFQGLRSPLKSCGNLIGKITASLSASLAAWRPATSSQCTLGLFLRMAPSNPARNLFRSASLLVGSLLFSPLSAPCVLCVCPSFPSATGLGEFCWSRKFFNCSARVIYSSTFARTVCLYRSFFSYFNAVKKYCNDCWYNRNASS
mmetsp:Transcript_3165/g.4630  ORF Transcript_3165/g.4630 Transcript_3165/m.4630 type:complete len:255 (+) Transcript_3165:571-1335(+)